MGTKSSQGSTAKLKRAREKSGQRTAPRKRTVTPADIEASLADAGFSRDRPLAAPYAIKTQRAKRDARHATRSPKPGELTILRAKTLQKIPWLVHGFSTRQGGITGEYGGGQLNLGVTKEDGHASVDKNRELFKKALGAETKGKPWPLVQVRQIHSAIIHRVRGSEPHPVAGDGLITDAPGILLAVKTADCLPVIAVDTVGRAVGVFHAGWRGTVQRIVEKGIGEMRRQFGSDPANVRVAIGPGIGSCCYKVGDEVVDEFRTQFAYADELIEEVFDSHALHLKYPLLFLNQRAPGHGEAATAPHLDLVKANLRQAIDAGVPAGNVEALNQCTSCRTDIFFSYRKEQVTGRMMGAVGIRR